MYTYIYVWICAHGWRCPWKKEEGFGSIGAGVTEEGFEHPEMGTGNWTPKFWELTHAFEYWFTTPTEFPYFYKKTWVWVWIQNADSVFVVIPVDAEEGQSLHSSLGRFLPTFLYCQTFLCLGGSFLVELFTSCEISINLSPGWLNYILDIIYCPSNVNLAENYMFKNFHLSLSFQQFDKLYSDLFHMKMWI